MSRPRWMKLARDLMTARGRMAMLVAAIAASIFALTLMLSTLTVMTREMTANYVGTNPASAFIELDQIDDALIDAVRQQPNIADAEATSWINGRVEVAPDQWMPLLLFVIPDFANARISTVSPEAGAYPSIGELDPCRTRGAAAARHDDGRWADSADAERHNAVDPDQRHGA